MKNYGMATIMQYLQPSVEMKVSEDNRVQKDFFGVRIVHVQGRQMQQVFGFGEWTTVVFAQFTSGQERKVHLHLQFRVFRAIPWMNERNITKYLMMYKKGRVKSIFVHMERLYLWEHHGKVDGNLVPSEIKNTVLYLSKVHKKSEVKISVT